jgi:beta-lactamase regulating signal transducer with metallopeptidase domain
MCKEPLFWFFAGIMGIYLYDLLLKITCLIILVISSPKEKRRLANTTFYLLKPKYNLPLAISSFTLWRHYVVFNPDLESKFTAEELKSILLHEVAHLRQHDTWQQFMLHTLRLFWWMQPMYYWFKKELDALNEYVADDFAVQHIGNAKQYAKTLIKAKEMQIQHEKMSLAMAFAKSLFKQRVLRVIDNSQPQTLRTTWVGLAVVIVVFWSTSAVALPFLQQQDITIKQYQVLQQQNESTGKISFCKSCLVEELKKEK